MLQEEYDPSFDKGSRGLQSVQRLWSRFQHTTLHQHDANKFCRTSLLLTRSHNQVTTTPPTNHKYHKWSIMSLPKEDEGEERPLANNPLSHLPKQEATFTSAPLKFASKDPTPRYRRSIRTIASAWNRRTSDSTKTSKYSLQKLVQIKSEFVSFNAALHLASTKLPNGCVPVQKPVHHSLQDNHSPLKSLKFSYNHS